MLDEGAGTRNALELADAVDFLGASLTHRQLVRLVDVRLHTPASKLDAALPLLADVVLRPTFPQNRARTAAQGAARRAAADARQPGGARLAGFARLRLRRRPSVRHAGDGQRGVEHEMTGRRSADVLRGQLPAAERVPARRRRRHAGTVLPKLEQALGGWKNAGAASPSPRCRPPRSQPRGRSTSSTSRARRSRRSASAGSACARTTPDYFVLDVLNTMLGGSFTSRLNQNLREEHGYAYGAGRSSTCARAPGPFVATAGVQTDKTVESLRSSSRSSTACAQPVPADELTTRAELEALGFPGEFETTSGMAGNLTELVVYGLPESFFSEYVPKIQAVTAADVERAAKQYLASDKFAVVVVGDLSKIEKPIRDANFGPVKVVTMDEVLR